MNIITCGVYLRVVSILLNIASRGVFIQGQHLIE